MKYVNLLAAAIAAASLAPLPATAQDRAPASQIVAIHYADLDLGTAAGRTSLDNRIRDAVRAACGDPSPVDLRGRNGAESCRADLNAALAGQRELALAGRGAATTLLARR
jgi:UrcA family protein